MTAVGVLRAVFGGTYEALVRAGEDLRVKPVAEGADAIVGSGAGLFDIRRGISVVAGLDPRNGVEA